MPVFSVWRMCIIGVERRSLEERKSKRNSCHAPSFADIPTTVSGDCVAHLRGVEYRVIMLVIIDYTYDVLQIAYK